MGYNLLPRIANVCESLSVHFTAIQTGCCAWSLVVADKACKVFAWTLKSGDEMQELEGEETQVAIFEANRAEQFCNIFEFESYDGELLDENWCLEHQMVVVKVVKERHEALDVESTRTVPDANVMSLMQMLNWPTRRRALLVLKGQSLADWVALHCGIEDYDRVLDKLATTSGNL